MIGLVLVTHGRLADEFVTAMIHVVGPQEQVAAIAIGPEDDMETRRADIAAAIAGVDTGDGVIVLTPVQPLDQQPCYLPWTHQTLHYAA